MIQCMEGHMLCCNIPANNFKFSNFDPDYPNWLFYNLIKLSSS